VLYSTLSPCDMCSGAILLYGIPTVVVGENTNFLGPQEYLQQRGVTVHVLDDAECIAIMRQFIETHAALWYEDIGK
jgi:cytosine/creatinine deaminase